jgi:hypothetical protein
VPPRRSSGPLQGPLSIPLPIPASVSPSRNSRLRDERAHGVSDPPLQLRLALPPLASPLPVTPRILGCPVLEMSDVVCPYPRAQVSATCHVLGQMWRMT